MSDCICDVKPPRYEHAITHGINKYAIYLTQIEDETVFDPACPFHGDNGSMVATLKETRCTSA